MLRSTILDYRPRPTEKKHNEAPFKAHREQKQPTQVSYHSKEQILCFRIVKIKINNINRNIKEVNVKIKNTSPEAK